MKQCLVAVGQRRSNTLSFNRRVPIGCGSNRSRIRSETDENALLSITFASKLSDVPLPAAPHLRAARVTQMGVVRPNHQLRIAVTVPQVIEKRLQSLGHVAITQVPRSCMAAEHDAVILFRILDNAGVLLCGEELVGGHSAIALSKFSCLLRQFDKLFDDFILA